MRIKKSIRKIKHEYRNASKAEITEAIIENFMFGAIGSTIVVFVSNKIDLAVFMSYVVYYFYVGKIVNRPKYETSLGKHVIFPLSAAFGAFSGYKLAQILSIYI
jgi:hypothetical protein